MKVDFMIIGAQKCATTTLFRILTRHPDIVGARVKEPHFFSTSPDWRRELPRYEALFDEQPGALYCEASTSYTFYPHRNLEIWDDLFAYNPALRFIYLVRDPVERQISPYIQRFSRDRVLILDFQDFMNRRRDTLRTVARFLDVDMTGLGDFEHVHANKSVGGRKQHHRFDNPPIVLEWVRRMLPGVWKRMVSRYSPSVDAPPRLSPPFERMIVNVLELEIRALETLMEKDLGRWRRTHAAAIEDQVSAVNGVEAIR